MGLQVLDEYVIASYMDHPSARKYLKLPFTCDFVSYGNGIVVSYISMGRNV